MANNKGLLTVIALVLIAILGVMIYNTQQAEKGPVETITSNIDEAVEEVGDEIDDNTDAK
jgi:hypothetical protein